MPVPTLHAVNTATTYCRANRLFQAWPLIVAKPNANLVPLGAVPEEDPAAGSMTRLRPAGRVQRLTTPASDQLGSWHESLPGAAAIGG
jgi:hypothetical protein